MPVIKTQDRIKELEPGDQFAVYCTDPGVLEDIPTWCRINGHTVLTSESNDQEICIMIQVEAPQ